jgi:hypothetical protein
MRRMGAIMQNMTHRAWERARGHHDFERRDEGSWMKMMNDLSLLFVSFYVI